MDSVLCETNVNYWANVAAYGFLTVVTVGYVFAIFVLELKLPYGRFFDGPWWAGPGLDPKISWLIQESPAFLFPFCTLVFSLDFFLIHKPTNAFLLLLFSCHYFNRTFIYPLLIRGGKPSSLLTVVFAFFFCLMNGFLQGHHLLCVADYPQSYHTDVRFILGVSLAVFGFVINIHSDGILRNLRKPGETGYKIPKGGMFEYVSSANLFGEIVEWWGFWIACSGLAAFVFAMLTTVVLAGKAGMHQRFYLEKFDDYPSKRKILLPFIW